jgi:glucosyl-3-phosphoglycerate synthase
MAGQVVSAVLARAASRRSGQTVPDASGLLTQFRHDGSAFVPRTSPVAVDERPPMDTVAEYRARQAGLAG